jgi:DNA-binding transcriptional LysR family regulator
VGSHRSDGDCCRRNDCILGSARSAFLEAGPAGRSAAGLYDELDYRGLRLRRDFSCFAKDSRLAGLAEIGIEDLRDQKIISFSRQNLSYTERYFAEMFAEHDLVRNIAYSCDDTFALISLVSAGLGIGFAPQWTRDFPNRNFELRKVRGVEVKIGMGVAWNMEDPTASRDDIIDIARSLVRPSKQVPTEVMCAR